MDLDLHLFLNTFQVKLSDHRWEHPEKEGKMGEPQGWLHLESISVSQRGRERERERERGREVGRERERWG